MLPTDNLQRRVRCPRCRELYVVADFVDRLVPLSAVPATDATQKPLELRDRPALGSDQRAGEDASEGPPTIRDQARTESEPALSTELMPVVGRPQGQAPAPTFPAAPPPAAPVPYRDPPAAALPRARNVALAKVVPTHLSAAWVERYHREPTHVATPAPPRDNLADALEKVDARLDGRRALLLGLSAAVVVISGWFESAFALYVIASGIFLVVLSFLVVARLFAMRRVDGGLPRQLGASAAYLWEVVTSTWKATLAERLRRVRNACLFLGFVVLALVPLVRRVALSVYDMAGERYEGGAVEDIVAVASGIGGLCVVFGLGAQAFRWHTARRQGGVPGGRDPEGGALSLRPFVRSFPPIADLTGGKAPPRVADPLVDQVFAALASWRPQRWCVYEVDYQRSLLLHLRGAMPPDISLKREYPIANQDGELRKLDIVVGKAIALELKRKLDASGSQRARGQVEDYLDLWQGPLLVVLCDTTPDFADSMFGRKVRDLHKAGRPIVAVAAGRRRRW